MKFRPCIDLHNGQVKQIVGSTLQDNNTTSHDASSLATNFSTDRPASEYAKLYKHDGLTGGHVIMLGGPGNTDAAKSALQEYPNGLQVGGGINDTNAQSWLDAGASHVIVTSFVFRNGKVDLSRLESLVKQVGKERLVLDLSCRRRKPQQQQEGQNNNNGPYYVVTDRWQKYTDVTVSPETLQKLAKYCSEFLVHGVEVEGKQCGILQDLVILLGQHSPIPVTYAGGVRSIQDLDRVKELGSGKVDLTIGSALDCFGGTLKYDDVVAWHKQENA